VKFSVASDERHPGSQDVLDHLEHLPSAVLADRVRGLDRRIMRQLVLASSTRGRPIRFQRPFKRPNSSAARTRSLRQPRYVTG
jgi:hypothetical protein